MKRQIFNNPQGQILLDLPVTFFGLSVAPIAIDKNCLDFFGFFFFLQHKDEMTSFNSSVNKSNHNQAYVEDSVITPGAIGGAGATTTMFGSNRIDS